MQRMKILLILLSLFSGRALFGQHNETAPGGYWQIGIGLGEIPSGGSFKPSFTLGYQINDHLYAGIIYQLKDQISRNASSFNASATGLEGLTASSESVGQRAMIQCRITPIKNGPYLSAGYVWNGKDTETMMFDDRQRVIHDEHITGMIVIQQTRPAGGGFALGIGYQYNFKNGISAGFEWTPAWGQMAKPSHSFSGTSSLSLQSRDALSSGLQTHFKKNVTNLYKVFHMGLSYRFDQ